MSHGSGPPTTMPACASASRTSSFARLVSNCESNFVAAALADTALLLAGTPMRAPIETVENEVDELWRGHARPREHPREAARDQAVGAARPCGLPVAVTVPIVRRGLRGAILQPPARLDD